MPQHGAKSEQQNIATATTGSTHLGQLLYAQLWSCKGTVPAANAQSRQGSMPARKVAAELWCGPCKACRCLQHVRITQPAPTCLGAGGWRFQTSWLPAGTVPCQAALDTEGDTQESSQIAAAIVSAVNHIPGCIHLRSPPGATAGTATGGANVNSPGFNPTAAEAYAGDFRFAVRWLSFSP